MQPVKKMLVMALGWSTAVAAMLLLAHGQQPPAEPKSMPEERTGNPNGQWNTGPVSRQIPEAAERQPPDMSVPAGAREQTSAERPMMEEVRIRRGHDTVEIAFSISVLVFGGVLTLAQILFMVYRKEDWTPISFRAFGMTLVLFAGLFLITAGYSAQQVTPIVGILGTMLGYIFGKGGA